MFGATFVATKSRSLSKVSSSFYLCTLLIGLSSVAGAQVSTFAGNEHHTNEYSVGGQIMNKVKWQTAIDNSGNGGNAHYGQPLITPGNTVITPLLNSNLSVSIEGIDGGTGSIKYTLNTGYTFPQYGWLPSYQPAITNGPNGERLYYQGIGGTIWYVDGIDTNTPSTPVQLAFYGLSNYTSNQANFNSSVFIDTPITIDSSGDLFFGFRVNGTAPAPISSTKSGWARIDSSGNGSYVLVDAMTGDSSMIFDEHNCAPALSNDESTVYVMAKDNGYSDNDNGVNGYLVGLANSSALTTKYQVKLHDPRPTPGLLQLTDDSTASPMVAPDGDVYFGVLLNAPFNGSRGALMHYSGDLSVTKTPGSFGWDFTPGVVPSSMVPSYHGSSSYLLFCKYNNYGGFSGDDGGDQINRVAILDPNDQTEVDWHPSSIGLVCMREVLTVIGCTPDSEAGFQLIPDNTREWCVNATAVDTANDCVFFNSEDGNTYRWNLSQNSIVQSVNMASAFGAPYVAQAIGPDGTLYTFNDIWLFAEGKDPNVGITIDSSSPDDGTFVSGSMANFTATVTGSGPTPTGTVTFKDMTYEAWDSGIGNFDTATTTLGTIPLVNGVATVSNVTLSSNTTTPVRPSHFITATYSGDGNYPAATVMRIQKVHPFGSSTAVAPTTDPTPAGQPVQLTATVSPVPNGSGTPTGYVYFHVGNKALGQTYMDGTGTATLTTSAIPAGTQTVSADYVSDTNFAASTGTTTVHMLSVASLTATPLKFRTGTTSTGTVNISSNVNSNKTVNLSSNNAALTVPSTVTVNSGTSSANFLINGTNSTYLDITGTITASYSGTQAQKSLIVQPDNRSTFVSQTVPTTMSVGGSYPVSLVFKNSGTLTWDTAHGYELYSLNPNNNVNFGVNRLPLTSGSVAPGANGTFSGNVSAPTTPGSYNFQWICYENSDNMQFGPGSPNVVVVVAPDQALYISNNVSTTINAGSDFNAQFTMKNVGSTTWTAAGGYSLMAINPNNNTTWGPSQITLPSALSVSPGQSPVLGATCTAPISPGNYTMQWQMNKSGTVFGQTTPLLHITVVQGADDAQYVSTSSIPTFVGPSTTFGATITMKNTGTATWSSAYELLQLPTATFGVSFITSGSVAPSANGAFTATFTAPSTPGTYSFRFRMSHSGTKFGQATPAVNIVVAADASQYISRSGATTVNAGADFSTTYTMKNTGTTTWTAGAGYSMLTLNALNNTTWGTNRLTITGSVAPGASYAFTRTLTAPVTPGSYNMQFQMNKSGTVFGQATPNTVITVVQGADDAVFVSQTVPTSVVHGHTFSATVRMKNTGTATWNGPTYSLAMLGTSNFGVPSVSAPTTAPNATGVFTATFTAPSTPGTYTFVCRMLHTVTRFGQASVVVNITVT